jgi:hypothetical protein
MKYIIIVFLGATILMSCTEEILVEREKIVYDTVYLPSEPIKVVYTQRDTVWLYRAIYDTIYQADTIVRVDTMYIQVIDTLEYSNTITVPKFWKRHVDNFLNAVEECNFPLFARDVVIDTTFKERIYEGGMDSIMYAYSYMKGNTVNEDGIPLLDGYWYINIDIAMKDCAEAIIYRELMHCLGGKPYTGDWRLWQEPYTVEKDNIMYQNWPGCLESMDEYQRAWYLHDFIPCIE